MNGCNEPKSIQELGCSINAISIDSLFDLYNRCGFLYSAKKQRLLPYLTEIKDNWKKASISKDDILSIFSSENQLLKKVASLVAWRSSMNSMTVQHLSSDGMPLLTRAVLLGALSFFSSYSVGLWYNPQNKYTYRLFGRFPTIFGDKYAYDIVFDYLFLEKSKLPSTTSRTNIRQFSNKDYRDAFNLVKSFTGDVFAKVEEFDKNDLELNQLDMLYNKSGLRRKRYFFAAYSKTNEPLGIAIVYRGPLGFNFSYLENASIVLFRDNIKKELIETAMNDLLLSIIPVYKDFTLNTIPILTSKICSQLLIKNGHTFFREYKKVVWLNELNMRCYEFIDNIYSRIIKRQNLIS